MQTFALRPNPGPQTNFLRSRVREVLFGGAAGGGKSQALLMHPLYCLKFEHERWVRNDIQASAAWAIHFRRTMPRLLQTIDRAKRMYFGVDPKAKFNEQTHTFTFACGMKIQFAHMERSDSY